MYKRIIDRRENETKDKDLVIYKRKRRRIKKKKSSERSYKVA